MPSAPAGAASGFIAGLAPWQRPANAPVIVETSAQQRAWIKQKGLTGISEPIPASLNFLNDQGGWYNPFLHAGMTGHYDLRGWYAAKH